MRRIDLMQKEEIIKFLTSSYEGSCTGCPIEEICNELKGKDCKETVLNYLLEDVEMVQRASIYAPEEAVRKFNLTQVKTQFNSIDLVDFAKFLMEKVPKPLDR